MLIMGLSEARRRFSELVRGANDGKQIGITRRGKLLAIIVPPPSEISVAEIFADIEKIRERVKPLKGITIKGLIEEGRE